MDDDKKLIEAVKAALNTEEAGAALIEVARDAGRAEMALAAFERRFQAEGFTLEGAYARLQEERAGA